jgi:hypothetical protein
MATVRQAGPRFLRLVANLQPTFHLRDITALEGAFIATHAISAVLWDVDGTLMPHHDRLVAPGLAATLGGWCESSPGGPALSPGRRPSRARDHM